MTGLFEDWRKKTADIKKTTTLIDATTGKPIESEVMVKAGVKVNYWISNTNVSNVNDKFVNQVVGRALLPPKLSIDTTMWLEIDGVKHYVVGVDDIAGFSDVLSISWRRAVDVETTSTTQSTVTYNNENVTYNGEAVYA